ncbi:MAG: hypothetical protein IBX69_07190, partial [Anaerolineales bacterium]|nr:hypothetical protein [Anaerolineales bacterium]
MNTIKRFYIYAVAFISFEVVLWGLIELARSLVAGSEIASQASQLAAALSLILVGIPVFLIHWIIAQRGSTADIEDRSARLRAIFLYGMLLATLLPTVHNMLALVNRQLADSMNIEIGQELIGFGQAASDNLIAIALNLASALFFYLVLRNDWQSPLVGDAFPEMRRIYRYIWLIYGLGIIIVGSQQILEYLLSLAAASGNDRITGGVNLSLLQLNSADISQLANGLSLIIIGLPTFAFAAFWIQRSLINAAERLSMLRLVVLYCLVFVSVVVVLISTGMLFEKILLWLFAESMTAAELISLTNRPVSAAVPFGLVWIYFGSILSREVNTLPNTPRRSGLRRLYLYILAALGLTAAFIGVHTTIIFLVDYSLGEISWDVISHSNLASSLASLAIGLPLWFITWRPMAIEAKISNEAGDYARRSLVRKSYIFLFLFLGLMGVMFSTGMLIFINLRTILGDPPDHLVAEQLRLFTSLILFALLLGYHWRILRKDIRLAESILSKKHAKYPVLVLASEDTDLIMNLVEALRRQVPAMPVSIHRVSQGTPDEILSAAKAVILPAELVANPPEGLRVWLKTFSGEHVVLPTPADGWHW